LRIGFAKPGDVLLSHNAIVGRVAVVPSCAGRLLLGTSLTYFRLNTSRISPRYFAAQLAGAHFQQQLAAVMSHSTRNQVPITAQKRLRVVVPPLGAQQAIAEVMGALDDKVELNRQMNETLEAIARALFKSWFVDFDSVRAKMTGRAPFGMDAATATLFPAALGADGIPIAWARRPLGALVDALSGGTPSKADPAMWTGDIPWISPKVMTEIFADDASSRVAVDAIGNGTRLAPSGATLVMVRGMGLHECVRVSQARRAVTFNQDVKALVPREIAPALLLMAMLDAQTELLGKVESSGHGTGKLPSEILLGYPIAMPSLEVQHALARTFDVLLDRIWVAREESRTLAELRDLLLPKLLSGELRIRDAEKAVEAAL
jgi:type I restriction enzyme S subunit